MIDSYEFGKIVVRGKEYTSDVIVYADRVDHTWQRRQSHYLGDYDLQDVIADLPQVLIVGTGKQGLLKVSPQLKQALHDSGVELVVAPTEQACRAYNRYAIHKSLYQYRGQLSP
jgi:hypothetical protein